MRTVASLLLLAAVAMASCPNSCSGHGRCTPGDLCECFLQADDRTPAYTGADCSLRVCPSGQAYGDLSDLTDDVDYVGFTQQTAFNGAPHASASTVRLTASNVDTRDFKLTRTAIFNVRVFSVDGVAGTVTVQWKLKEHSKYSQAIVANAGASAFSNMVELQDANKLLPNFGTADHSTGVRIWFSSTAGVQENDLYTFTVNYRGKAITDTEPNSAHQYIECSGTGTCDRTTGTCVCSPGFGGLACQRLECPNDCSGHGVCQTLRRFVEDADSGGVLGYNNAWDAEQAMTCSCDAGYRGPDCSEIECPSGADPMGGPGGLGVDQDNNLVEARDCSGRGTCDYSTGTCSCYGGYHGERCEYQTTFV